MKKQYAKPVVEKISFDYKIQTQTTSDEDCFESVMNERAAGSTSTECVGGTPISMGWTLEETLVGG